MSGMLVSLMSNSNSIIIIIFFLSFGEITTLILESAHTGVDLHCDSKMILNGIRSISHFFGVCLDSLIMYLKIFGYKDPSQIETDKNTKIWLH